MIQGDVNIDDFLATDEVWHDAKGGDRPTEDAIESTFGTQDIEEIAKIIFGKGFDSTYYKPAKADG